MHAEGKFLVSFLVSFNQIMTRHLQVFISFTVVLFFYLPSKELSVHKQNLLFSKFFEVNENKEKDKELYNVSNFNI